MNGVLYGLTVSATLWIFPWGKSDYLRGQKERCEFMLFWAKYAKRKEIKRLGAHLTKGGGMVTLVAYVGESM
jgi:hypothetical protein